MKIIKIIDLYNKIVKGETMPKEIIWCHCKYEWNGLEENYYSNSDDNGLFDYAPKYKFLNDEVEIIEEEPRDIEVCGSWFTKSEYDKLAHSEEEKKIPKKIPLSNYHNSTDDIKEKVLINKINEIIDYLNSKGEK